MTDTDLLKTKETLELIKATGLLTMHDTIAIHSPWEEQTELFRQVFATDPTILTIDDWDINNPYGDSFGMLYFSNVFMYIANPAVALVNVLNSCKYLLIQDIIKRKRGKAHILCEFLEDDGQYRRKIKDEMRFSFGDLKSDYPGSFDLSMFADRMVFFSPYLESEGNISFIALLKGIDNE